MEAMLARGWTDAGWADSRHMMGGEGVDMGVGADEVFDVAEALTSAASARGGLESLEVMLSMGADPNSVNGMGDTPLHSAAGSPSNDGERTAKIELLVRAGARAGVSNGRGMTPLHALAAAAVAGTGAEVDAGMLAGAGADVSATDCNGNSPLHWAVSGRARPDMGLVSVLLRLGGDPWQANKMGVTPLDSCVSNEAMGLLVAAMESGALGGVVMDGLPPKARRRF